VGNRLPGLGAAGALIIAQFMAALLTWWMPSPPDPAEVEQVGPSMSLAMAVFIVLVYAYSVTLEYAAVGEWLKGQGLIVLLIAAAVVALPRLFWREEDPWLLHPGLPRGVALAFIAPIVVLGLIVSGLGVDPVPPPLGTTLRIATYNINRGYDAAGAFQLELVARTIEASHADIVLLQEVDAGSPASYGIDEVQYLARRLDMSQAFLPTTEQVRGLAVLSRWPLSSRAGALFPSTGEQDGALSVSIRDADSGHSVTLINAELAPGTDEERVQQLAVLLGLIGDSSPAVVGGSFSGSPQDIVYQQLASAGFADPDSVLGIEQGYTTPAVYPTVRYDYVLVRDLSALDSRQVDSAASDHRLVVVEAGWSSN
jgi:endonuclease/exonuclease/phosphatase family metal-dependent hydrolase